MIPAALPGVELASAADSAPHDTGVGGSYVRLLTTEPIGILKPVSVLIGEPPAGYSCENCITTIRPTLMR